MIKEPYLKRLSFIFILFLFFSTAHDVYGARIKDLIDIKGIRSNQLIGYGLVVGLDGTGDKSGTEFTVQSLANMMSQMGIYVSKNKLKVKNVAAVIITAQMPPFARIGSRIDITASSVGDAQSLAGGTLLLTPLHGVDGKVYAIAQGAIALGGVGASGQGGTSITKNHLQTARVPGGATVECEIPVQLDGKDLLTLSLLNPDFTTVMRISKTINTFLGLKAAKAVDSGTLRLMIPSEMQMNVAQYIAEIEKLQVTPDTVAKIVVNEKTGTVVIGENVRISTVAISHGNMSITVKEHEEVSQPGILSRGETVTVKDTDIQIEEEKSEVILLPKSTTIGELVRALNAIGVTPRDMISIFQSIKAAGALQAELEIT